MVAGEVVECRLGSGRATRHRGGAPVSPATPFAGRGSDRFRTPPCGASRPVRAPCPGFPANEWPAPPVSIPGVAVRTAEDKESK